MGRTNQFECPKCGHRAKVAGGAERGLHFAVQTLLCHDCKQLYDVVTAMKTTVPGLATMSGGQAQFEAVAKPLPTAPAFLAALNRLPPTGAKRFKWVHFKVACPVSAHHRIREWRSPDKCPKCGCILECSAIAFRLWD